MLAHAHSFCSYIRFPAPHILLALGKLSKFHQKPAMLEMDHRGPILTQGSKHFSKMKFNILNERSVNEKNTTDMVGDMTLNDV